MPPAASCVPLVVVALCALSAAHLTALHSGGGPKENLLIAEGFSGGVYGGGGAPEPESYHVNKCYDEESKTAYKVDATWHPAGKCEKRVCTRQRDSKTPIIKITQCEPCLTCDSPDKMCHPFKSEKSYPKCCEQCLTKSAIIKKTGSGKKYKAQESIAR